MNTSAAGAELHPQAKAEFAQAPEDAPLADLDFSALPEVVNLDAPRDGVPAVIDTEAGLKRACAALAKGTGPVAVDTERASGFRYGQRAMLIQLKRQGAGIWLIDPEALSGLSALNDALSGVEWILHAASQDLPCLAEQGMWPFKLFDTELAGRLAGLAKVGLGAMVEELLGFKLAKEHSAADWSTRPLPEPWLRYAALDVDILIELREEMIDLLKGQGKLLWAKQEFAAIVAAGVPEPRVDPWRRTSGIHSVRDRRKLAAVRELWTERENLAKNRDVAPGKLLPDSAIVVAAKALPTTVPELLGLHGFHGRAAAKEAPRWLRALSVARKTSDLPPLSLPSSSPPPVLAWAERNPLAAARLATAKAAIADLSEQRQVPHENLLTPDYLRRLTWSAPETVTSAYVREHLAELGARPWQITLVAPIVLKAFKRPDPLPAKRAKPEAKEG